MKQLRSWHLWLYYGRGMPSLPRIVLLVSPFTVVLLGIMVLAFQLNRQLYDQQQVIVNRLNHASVRHTGQLQREHLRLWGLIASTGETVDTEAYSAQHDLVTSRIQVLEFTLRSANADKKVWELFNRYAIEWNSLQPLLEQWFADPQNTTLKTEIGSRMAGFELLANQAATEIQASFEGKMSEWSKKSLFLNRLLTIGSFSFIVIILFMAYGIYLLFQEESTHQETLRTSEQRLRVILDAIPDAVYRVSSAGIYTDYKPANSDRPHVSNTTFYRKHLRDVLPAEIADLLQHGIQTVLTKQQPLLLSYALIDQKDHSNHLYEARLLPSGGDEVQIIVREVTEEKEREEAAIQAQKLESLGVLAGGIAHDFNNLLTGMLGQASLAVAKLNRGLPALDHVQKVVISAERASDLTKQLLAYAGKGKFQIDLLDINRLIRDTIGLMDTVIPGQAKLHLCLQESLPFVRVDRGQIQQVIMNLFINAIEALPDGRGSITITTGAEWIDGNIANIATPASAHAGSTAELPPGTYVTMRLEDTGIGMDQATLSRIFDPFFSTKSKGHGLGLAATMGIIRTHDGGLYVQSQPSAGTIFTLLLPASVAEDRKCEEQPSVLELNSTEQTVLIIDDEEYVREVASDILAEHGFHVIAASNGSEGIDLYRTNQRQIDIVLLDMKMPGLNGKDTFYRLRKIEPNLKVIFTSGYSDTEIDLKIHEAAHVTFLPKPYDAEVLTQQVHQMLLG